MSFLASRMVVVLENEPVKEVASTSGSLPHSNSVKRPSYPQLQPVLPAMPRRSRRLFGGGTSWLLCPLTLTFRSQRAENAWQQHYAGINRKTDTFTFAFFFLFFGMSFFKVLRIEGGLGPASCGCAVAVLMYAGLLCLLRGWFDRWVAWRNVCIVIATAFGLPTAARLVALLKASFQLGPEVGRVLLLMLRLVGAANAFAPFTMNFSSFRAFAACQAGRLLVLLHHTSGACRGVGDHVGLMHSINTRVSSFSRLLAPAILSPEQDSSSSAVSNDTLCFLLFSGLELFVGCIFWCIVVHSMHKRARLHFAAVTGLFRPDSELENEPHPWIRGGHAVGLGIIAMSTVWTAMHVVLQ